MSFLERYKRFQKILSALIIVLAVSLPLAIKFVVMFFEISNFGDISSQTLIYFIVSSLGFMIWAALLIGVALYNLHQYGKYHYLKDCRSLKDNIDDNPEFKIRNDIQRIMQQTLWMAIFEAFKNVAISTAYILYGLGYFLYNILKYPVIILGLLIILLSIFAAFLQLFKETGTHLSIFEIHAIAITMKISATIWGLIISVLAISGFYFVVKE